MHGLWASCLSAAAGDETQGARARGRLRPAGSHACRAISRPARLRHFAGADLAERTTRARASGYLCRDIGQLRVSRQGRAHGNGEGLARALRARPASPAARRSRADRPACRTRYGNPPRVARNRLLFTASDIADGGSSTVAEPFPGTPPRERAAGRGDIERTIGRPGIGAARYIGPAVRGRRGLPVYVRRAGPLSANG